MRCVSPAFVFLSRPVVHEGDRLQEMIQLSPHPLLHRATRAIHEALFNEIYLVRPKEISISIWFTTAAAQRALYLRRKTSTIKTRKFFHLWSIYIVAVAAVKSNRRQKIANAVHRRRHK